MISLQITASSINDQMQEDVILLLCYYPNALILLSRMVLTLKRFCLMFCLLSKHCFCGNVALPTDTLFHLLFFPTLKL